MTRDARKLAAAEELQLAREELLAADHLLAAKLARVTLGRAYFAAFHACRAMLYAEGLEPRSHHGALHLFNLHLVKAGRFEPSTSRLLARLQKFREEADYGDSFPVDEAGAREELEAARGFVGKVEQELAKPED